MPLTPALGRQRQAHFVRSWRFVRSGFEASLISTVVSSITVRAIYTDPVSKTKVPESEEQRALVLHCSQLVCSNRRALWQFFSSYNHKDITGLLKASRSLGTYCPWHFQLCVEWRQRFHFLWRNLILLPRLRKILFTPLGSDSGIVSKYWRARTSNKPLTPLCRSSRSWTNPANICVSMKRSRKWRTLREVWDFRNGSLRNTRSPRSVTVIFRE